MVVLIKWTFLLLRLDQDDDVLHEKYGTQLYLYESNSWRFYISCFVQKHHQSLKSHLTVNMVVTLEILSENWGVLSLQVSYFVWPKPKENKGIGTLSDASQAMWYHQKTNCCCNIFMSVLLSFRINDILYYHHPLQYRSATWHAA